MPKIRDDLKGLYRNIEKIFDRFYAESELSRQNDSVFDDIIREVECALENHIVASEPEKQEDKVILHMITEIGRIDDVLARWMESRDELRSRGAGMNRSAIPIMQKEVLAVFETV